MPRSAPFAALFATALLIAPPLISCARNPVTGKNELSLVSESQEIEMGKEANQQTIQSIGLVNDPQLQEYVSGIGLKIAKASERPNLPWEFHVVNDASVNAFALPGGFIFVTRGLLTYINDEAELATVRGSRDRSRDEPPLGPTDQQEPDRGSRTRAGQHSVADGRAVSRESRDRVFRCSSSSTAAMPRARPTWRASGMR